MIYPGQGLVAVHDPNSRIPVSMSTKLAPSIPVLFVHGMIQTGQLVTWHRVDAATVSTIIAILWRRCCNIRFCHERRSIGDERRSIGGCRVVGPLGGWVCHLPYLLGGVMGDFLGTTICVTEILALTLILILTSEIPRTWEDVWTATVSARVMAIQRNDVVFFQWAMEHAALRGHPVGALAHVIGLLVLTVLWCSFVVHPIVLVRETVVRALPFWSSPMSCPPILAEK